ncbi:hypothetical protein H9L39_18200 [Fusarium oxysporum f. sp. albedinis]|nr:hypothetical protein H9L39_18200 [Fusarium oxysporum f. sp. albedinis]
MTLELLFVTVEAVAEHLLIGSQIALGGFNYDQGKPKTFKQENGVVREFCDNCGAFIYEYGEQAADKFRYIM